MYKLKRIIVEGLEKINVPVGKVPTDVTFTLSETDPWEYKLSSPDNTIYTREKGQTEWKKMKDVASNYNLARQRITSMDKYTDTNTKKVSNTKIDASNQDNSSAKTNDKSLVEDYKTQQKIVDLLFDMIVKHPEKYFERFRSTFINDNEQGAAIAFKKKQNGIIQKLDTLVNKDNIDIKENTKQIKLAMDVVYKSIKENKRIKQTLQITDPTFKSTSTSIKERTYRTTLYWQYFHN